MPRFPRFSSLALFGLAALSFFGGIGLQAQVGRFPEWARGAIWYQILPDRFENGDEANDPTGKEVLGDTLYPWKVSNWSRNWYHMTIGEKLFSPDFYANAFLRHYGGDIAGMRLRLPYLQTLGVNVILVNPVFEAVSYHRYDFSSLHHVDPHLGPVAAVDTAFVNREVFEDPATWYLTSADRAFADFIKDAHDRGMKVVLDVQFTHASVHAAPFKDLLKNQEKSKYVNWFEVEEWDRPETPFLSEFHYKSMWGVPALPLWKVDTLGLAPGPKSYIWAATRKWMDPNGDSDPSDGVDGWRVSLTKTLERPFWATWVAHVKSINPAALVIGDAPSPKDLSSKPFDIVSQKEFGNAVSKFFLNRAIAPTQYDQLLSLGYGTAVNPDAIINIINDHETDRLASMCVNRFLPYDSLNSPRSNPSYNVGKPDAKSRKLQKLVLLMQFTHLGSPLIYYGDPAGMWGADDPDCRKPMEWPDKSYEDENSFAVNGDNTQWPTGFDSTMHEYYRYLIGLRQKHLALRSGTTKTIILDDKKMLYGIYRESGADRVYICVNAGMEVQECPVPLIDVREGTRLDDPLNGVYFYAQKGYVTLLIPPESASILIPAF